MRQKVRVSNCIRILVDSIFVKFQPLNKYSKGVKMKCGLKGQIVYSRLNYCKVKISENSGTEWDEIDRETVWKIGNKALKKIIHSFLFFM